MAQNWKKLFARINWQNKPSTATALGATNLNKSDYALDQIDDRVIQLDTLKADMQTVNGMVADVSVNTTNGIITVTKKDGSKQTFDTKLEKLAVNFSYDATNQRLVITLDDGTKQYVDMSALINEYDFKDTSTVAFSVSGGKVEASVKDGSITEEKLQPNYLANIKTEVAKAENSVSAAANSATAASASATAAADNATLSKSYAIGGTGTRPSEDTDNAKFYYEKTRDKSFDLDTTTVSDFGNPVELPTAKGNIIDFKANGYVKRVGEPYSGGWTNGMWQHDGGFTPGGDAYSSDNTAWADRIRCKPGDVIELLGSDNYNIAHATIVFGDEDGVYVDGVLIENGKAYWHSKGDVPQDISGFKIVVPSGSAENLDFSVMSDRTAEVNNYKEVSLLINNSPSHLEALGDLGCVDLGTLNWSWGWNSSWYTDDITNGNAKSSTEISKMYSTNYTAATQPDVTGAKIQNSVAYWKSGDTKRLAVYNGSSTTKPTGYLAYETDKGFANKYALPIISKSPNLLQPTMQTMTTNGVTCTNNGDGTYTVNGTATANTFFYLIGSNDIKNMYGKKIVGCPVNNVNARIYAIRTDTWASFLETGNGITINSGDNNTNWNIRIQIIANTTCNNLVFKPMITEDLTATYDTFQPYAKSTSIIPLTEPLFNGDVIYKYADGSGKIVKKMGQVDLGTIAWNENSSGLWGTNALVTSIKKPANNNVAISAFAEKYTTDTGNRVYGKVSPNIIGASDQGTIFCAASSSPTGKLVYELATPYEIPLTAEQVKAFESVATFKGITILSMPFDSTMDVTAFKNNKDGETVSGLSVTKSGSSGGSGFAFSTEEHVIGTWLDGKPLYEKTYQFQTPTTYTDSTLTFNLGLYDLDDFMIDISHSFLVGKYVSAVRRNPNINLRSGNTTAESQILNSSLNKNLNTNEIYFQTRIDNSGNYLNCTLYLTVQYTKTTDTATISTTSIQALDLEEE